MSAEGSPSPLSRFRRVHERDVVAHLRVKGALSRKELQSATGLSRTTLYAIVADLLDSGVLRESKTQEAARPGRPETLLTVDPDSAFVVGVEIGRSHVVVVASNQAHDIVGSAEVMLAADHPTDGIAESAVQAIERVLGEAKVDVKRVDSVVVGTPLSFGRAQDGAEPITQEISRLVSSRIGVEAIYENNARLVALAEAQVGVARDCDDLAYVHLDTGVGGGLVLNGNLLAGSTGTVGEFGHVCVDPDGPRCWCGGSGCLETYVGLPRLLEAAGVADVADLARGEVLARVDDRLARLAQVISGMLVALDVRVVVLGGSVGRVPGVAATVNRMLKEIAPSHIAGEVDVRVAELGAYGSARGGIALAFAAGDDLTHYERPVR